ncbi:hypothetical protein T09_8332 [Trichinella sp. T9]|nr:hypothetical protein T09_8332 [Trichinella sp. T9]
MHRWSHQPAVQYEQATTFILASWCVASHFVQNLPALSLFAHAEYDCLARNFPIARLTWGCVASHFVQNLPALSLFAHAKRDWWIQKFQLLDGLFSLTPNMTVWHGIFQLLD